MISVTTKTQYGITAVIELAKNHEQGLLKIRDIVERRRIPQNYLEQIFNQLQTHGIVKSTRGSRGGYELADSPVKISLLRVLEALEGETQLADFKGPESVQELFLNIVNLARATLDVPLTDIVARQEKYDQRLMFYI